MEVTLEQLLKGKATKIKKNEYSQTEAYVTPFLERMSKYTDDFRCSVKCPRNKRQIVQCHLLRIKRPDI